MKNFIKSSFRFHFEWRHLLILLGVMIVFQIFISYVNSLSIKELQKNTIDWYKQDAAEKFANLTATSLELLLETSRTHVRNDYEIRKLIQSFNIILSQQLLQENVEAMSIVIPTEKGVFAVDNGQDLYDYLYRKSYPDFLQEDNVSVSLFEKYESELVDKIEVQTISVDNNSFQVLVPLVPNGEFSGALFLEIKPDFSFLTTEVSTRYNETALAFTSLIIFGLLTIFYISSYTMRERDEAQKLLLRERENFVKEQTSHQKESLFTKRIYHTHHKAEKIMGFIKEDLNSLDKNNMQAVKERVKNYASFISRVIYDMKWYDPPLQTIRNQMFKSDVNKIINFIVKSIFLRVSENANRINFDLKLDPDFPIVHINEFVIWEIIEPLIQNSIDHSANDNLLITIETKKQSTSDPAKVIISDNGNGISPELLEDDKNGLKRIFQENISTKRSATNSGYGCYISFEIAKRCGWKLDAQNLDNGSQFTIILN